MVGGGGVDVAGVVVDRRQLDPLASAAIPRRIDDGVEALVDEVGGEDHQGSLHQPGSFRTSGVFSSTSRIQGTGGGISRGSSSLPATKVWWAVKVGSTGRRLL